MKRREKKNAASYKGDQQGHLLGLVKKPALIFFLKFPLNMTTSPSLYCTYAALTWILVMRVK